MFTIGSPVYGHDSCKYTPSFNQFLLLNDAMLFLISIFSITLFYFIKISSECQSNGTLWTYYPCSFIISPTSFNCSYISIKLSIDQCINKEIILFWHLPFGNMTLTIQSDNNQSFLLHLSKTSISTNKLIKNIYHLINNNNTEEERLINNMMILYSDKYNQCSIKFETTNLNIFDYGIFIRMTILTTENKKF